MRSILSVSVPKQVVDDLSKAAKRLGLPRSLLVRQAIERYVLELKFRDLQLRLKPYARKAGILTDEDVFSRIS